MTATQGPVPVRISPDDRLPAAARARSDAPLLRLGAVEVLSGQFKTFTSSADEISVDAVLASAAIPTLFRSVQVGSGVYWDGLFSQNPPVTQLISSLPDEIWVVQINPTRIEREPKTVSEIANRRNELAGNLSLYQELGFIEHLDHFLETGAVSAGAAQPVTVRVLEMDRPASSTRWGYASKLNRDPDFITELIDLGVAQTETFLTALGFEQAWLSGEAEQVLAYCDEGTTVCARGRVAHCEPTDDPGRVRAFIRDRLADTLRVERSRKRICRGRVSWEIRQDGTADRAHAVARFEDGMLRDLRIDDEPDWSPL